MSNHNHGVSISMLYPIMKTLVNKGYESEAFFEYAGLDPAMMQNPEARIPVEELERIMQCAARYSDDLYFGLNQGQLLDFADLGLPGYVMMHSKTIGDALAAYQRYNIILYSGFNLSWEVSGEDLILQLSLQHSEKQMSRHCVEDMAVSMVYLISKLANRRVKLKEVRFSHQAPDASGDLSPYVGMFGIEPRFGDTHTLLRMHKDILDQPVLYSDARMLKVFETMAQESKDELHSSQSFSSKVSRWMMKCLPTFFPTLQHTAEHLGVSIRTLQSRLREEDTTYHEISVQVRKEMALRYLQKGTYSVGDIAYALHFSEQSAFQNAFKKWTGQTPGQYRSSLKQPIQPVAE
ncbi:AraC family transcriptional regulator [Paenibacillus sp. NPDC056933]|uniref:AraC family transcriptional regulator n=1 Tax=Paenibacillus sp. NPDC056933 TaxID=3345968 RepID=UPI003640B817